MTTTTVTVNVTITAKGATPSGGVGFTFTAGAGMPSGVFSPDGSLDFSKAFTKGTVVTVVFNLQTALLAFGSSTYPLSLYGQEGASNTCWISQTKPPPGPYPSTGTEFTFAPNALPPGYASLSIIDNNDDGLTWYYELFVWVGGSAGLKFGHDPHIINHSNNK